MTLFDIPVARTTDPETAHKAAKSVRADTVTKAQKLILEILKGGPATDEQIFAALTVRGFQISTSGSRTRRKELQDAGLVVDSLKRGKTSSGRDSILWRVK